MTAVAVPPAAPARPAPLTVSPSNNAHNTQRIDAARVAAVHRARAQESMMHDMELLHTSIELEPFPGAGTRARLSNVLVDTGAELSWVPAAVLEALGVHRLKVRRTFTMADGQPIVGDVGFAVVHASGEFTVDEVVFAEPGDLTLLGARTLEGLNLRVDLVAKRLVAAGPIIAAAAT